jgi:hypothetical protein
MLNQTGLTSVRQIIQKLGCGPDPGHQQLIVGAGTRDVEKAARAVVDFFEIGIVGYILDAHLRRDDLVVAHTMSATARTSSPFARCIVPIGSLPGAISILSRVRPPGHRLV